MSTSQVSNDNPSSNRVLAARGASTASSVLEPTTACTSILSLPPLVVETVVGHVLGSYRPAWGNEHARVLLLESCTALRQVVLQQAPGLTLQVRQMGFDRSFREAAAVFYRPRPMDKLVLDFRGSTPLQAQQLMSELAIAAAQAKRMCAVSTLTIWGDISHCPGLLGAFPSITELSLFEVQIGPSMLHGLEQCTRLAKLLVRGCTCESGVTPHHLTPCLPAIRDLTLSHYEKPKQDAPPWLPALAPQLTRLECDRELTSEAGLEDTSASSPSLDDAGMAALAQCTQLVEISITNICKATLGVLLGLPSLAKVSCFSYEADAMGKHCRWSHFTHTGYDGLVAAHLPKGIHTLTLTAMALKVSTSPVVNFAAAQDLANSTLGVCHTLCWAEGPIFEVCDYEGISGLPPDQGADCLEATLKGLAPLRPSLDGKVVEMDLTFVVPVLSSEVKNVLAAASSYLAPINCLYESI